MRHALLTAALLIATTFPLCAQTILLPPGNTYPLAKSTIVNPDHTITFRLADPTAKQVLLHYDMSADPIPMVRDTTGVWSFTSAPLPPEIYAYTLTVDGEPRLDPSNRRINEVATGAVSQSIEVPGPTPQPWDLTDIPHGTLSQHRFTTAIGKNFPGNQSSYLVYTPPGFNPRATTKYPVLYLLNGYSQLETGWRDLHANLILDTLIAQHKAVPHDRRHAPLLRRLVLPRAKAWRCLAGSRRRLRQHSPLRPGPHPRDHPRRSKPPTPVSDRPQVTAPIAGLSMGGLEALTIGLNDTDPVRLHRRLQRRNPRHRLRRNLPHPHREERKPIPPLGGLRHRRQPHHPKPRLRRLAQAAQPPRFPHRNLRPPCRLRLARQPPQLRPPPLPPCPQTCQLASTQNWLPVRRLRPHHRRSARHLTWSCQVLTI